MFLLTLGGIFDTNRLSKKVSSKYILNTLIHGFSVTLLGLTKLSWDKKSRGLVLAATGEKKRTLKYYGFPSFLKQNMDF